jgi:hypothetical protein
MEFHVMVYGNDTNSGTLDSPFRTISKAARIALLEMLLLFTRAFTANG